jgi:hypothetical protein
MKRKRDGSGSFSGGRINEKKTLWAGKALGLLDGAVPPIMKERAGMKNPYEIEMDGVKCN